eukprot:SAG31_NODE_734_length_12489_cov_6.922034_7_plen_61_part_00
MQLAMLFHEHDRVVDDGDVAVVAVVVLILVLNQCYLKILVAKKPSMHRRLCAVQGILPGV